MVCCAFGLFAEAGQAADTQIPKVAIASPVVGATIAGTVVVTGTASDNVSVSKVELRVDGNAYQLASGKTSWTFSLNTSAYANGGHTLTVRVTDSSGNKAWASTGVTVSNGGVDLQVPRVAISTPAAGATIAGTVVVTGTASDNVSVSKVELRVDGNAYQLASGKTSWTFSLNTTAYTNGSHTLTVRATDTSGKKAWASTAVTISNGSGGSKIYWGAYIEGTQTYSYLYGGSWGNAPWSSPRLVSPDSTTREREIAWIKALNCDHLLCVQESPAPSRWRRVRLLAECRVGSVRSGRRPSSRARAASARTTGGARFVSAIDAVTGAPTAGVTLAAGGGSWASLSDRNAKEGFTAVDKQALLRRLAGIPIERWSYRAQGWSTVHMGPTAQNFSRAFGLGEDNRHITTIDADGVALAAIQGLHRQNKALQRVNRALRAQLAAQNARLTKLERAFSKLSQ